MFDFPNSSAMDATASSGGPSTFLFQIVTGQPEQIAQHSAGLLQKATQFISLMDEFTKAAEQLGKVWSGQASDSAVKKITSSLQSFQKIIQVIQNGSKLLGISGTLVQSAQTAYKSVVGAVNPTVASLMSNPWTYSAAVALSTATSASLRAFITAIQGLLQGLGVGQLAQEIAALVSIITEIEQLAKGSSSSTGTTPSVGTVGSVPTNATISATPISAPLTPPPVATAAGQAAAQNPITNYTPPALAGYTNPTAPTVNGTTPAVPTIPGANGTSPTMSPTVPTIPGAGGMSPTLPTMAGAGGTSPAGLTPSIDPSNSWIAVDPNAANHAVAPPAAAPPAAPPPAAPTGQEVSVTTTDHGITTTVQVPAGQAAQVHLDATVNNDHITENFTIGADGSVHAS